MSYEGMGVDLQLRKKLDELLTLRGKLEGSIKSEQNPIKEQRLKENLTSVDELIGVIRYTSLDELGVISKAVESDEKEKNDERMA